MAKEIIKHKSKYNPDNSMGQPTFPSVTVNTKLKDLIGPNSWLMFSLFSDASWLQSPVQTWSNDSNYTVT